MIHIIAVGTIKEKYIQTGLDDFIKRIERFDKVKVTQIQAANPSFDDERIINDESERLIKACGTGYVILCDRIGKEVTSEKLSQIIQNANNSGKSEIVFVVGGSMGVSDQMRKRADYSVSFSQMTFPHELFRLMLTEQIYRSFKILHNEKYHK